MLTSSSPSASVSPFAFLTPANLEARRAFNDVAERLEDKSDGGELLHASRFMSIKPYGEGYPNASAALDDDDETSADATGTDTVTEAETEAEIRTEGQPRPLRTQGHYALSFANRPSIAAIGWVIGVGRWDGKGAKQNGGIDIQLALPRTPFSKYEVAGKHARLFFDDTGSLIIRIASDRCRKIVLCDDEFTSGQRVITQRRNRISFGKLSYMLEFGAMDETEYQRNLRNFFSNHLGRQPPAPDLSATPSPWDSKFGNWLVRKTVGKGSFATVSAAKHTVSGVAGAAKFMVRTQESYLAIAREIELLKSLPFHPQILQFHHVEYERQDRWFTGPLDEEDERYSFKARPERVVIIYTPYARATVAEFFRGIPMRMRLVAFHQILQGVLALHNAGFIHRDLKPANIGVVKLSPPEINIVILDYGQTIRAAICDPRPGSVGTVPYLAPEMERTSYGRAVDIWACGIVGLQLFITDGKLGWRDVVDEKTKFDRTFAALRGAASITIDNLLSQMLAWDPKERMSAESALSHSCFSSLPHNNLQSVNVRAGQKRVESQIS